MPNELSEVSGTIDLAQFWPSVESHTDTVEIKWSGNSAFRFSAHSVAPSKITHAFELATARGRVSKPVIDTQERVAIRLQGIEAPELHYRPTAPTLNGQKPVPAQRAAFNTANGNFRYWKPRISMNTYENGHESGSIKKLCN